MTKKSSAADDSIDSLGQAPEKQTSTEDLLKDLVSQLKKSNELIDKQAETLDKQAKQIEALKQTNQAGNLTPEMLEKILRNNREDAPSDIGNPIKYYREADIDPDDVVKGGIVFYHYGTGHVIVDDLRDGKPVKTPFNNTIFFMHQATQKIQNGKNTDLYSYSAYISYSKKEIAWLRKHSKYGISFFESAKEAMQLNSDFANRIQKHINALNGMSAAQIVGICKDKSIPFSNDINKMKNELASLMVREEVDREKESQMNFFADQAKDRELLASK